jgi:HAD superfamily phosphoserine phosphatase-like hydrolase
MMTGRDAARATQYAYEPSSTTAFAGTRGAMEGRSREGSDGGTAEITREPPAGILDRIARAHGGGDGARAAIAFDADGTLWEGDVGEDLFEAFLAERGARPAAEAALVREAEAHGASAAGAHDAARSLYEAFRAGRYPEDRAFAMMAWCFAGWTEAEVADLAERVLEERRIEARLRAALRPVLEWARARGVDVFVVSASPRAIVERGVRRLGLPAERVLAMTPAVRDGRLLPELGAPATYGDGKVRALERAVPAGAPGEPLALLAAFGDSAYDAPMLRAARVPVAVAPSPKLLALAPTLPGLIVLDP